MRFRNRYEAGRQLAEALHRYGLGVIYAIPRSGVVLGVEVARSLALPLEVVVTRKVAHPRDPARTVAVVTETGDLVINRGEVAQVKAEWLRQRIFSEQLEARRCRKLYTDKRPPVEATGKLAIIVDDGAVTGLTLQATVRALQAQRPERLVIAVPFLPRGVAAKLAQEVDDIVALDTVDEHVATVGLRYEDFPPVSEEEVSALLRTPS